MENLEISREKQEALETLKHISGRIGKLRKKYFAF